MIDSLLVAYTSIRHVEKRIVKSPTRYENDDIEIGAASPKYRTTIYRSMTKYI